MELVSGISMAIRSKASLGSWEAVLSGNCQLGDTHSFLPTHKQGSKEITDCSCWPDFFQTSLPATRFVYMGSFSPSKSLGTTTGCDRSDAFRFCLSPGQKWGKSWPTPASPAPSTPAWPRGSPRLCRRALRSAV